MVLVSDTLARFGLIRAVLGRFPIVAVPMEQVEIYQPIGATQATRDDMIHFPHILRLDEQPTIDTSPLLILQEVSRLGTRQRVVFQPLREVG